MIDLGTIHVRQGAAIFEARDKVFGLTEALQLGAIECTRLSAVTSEMLRQLLDDGDEVHITVGLVPGEGESWLILGFEGGRGLSENRLQQFFDEVIREHSRVEVRKRFSLDRGHLTDTFIEQQRAAIQRRSREELLRELQAQNLELADHRTRLEEIVAERTKELAQQSLEARQARDEAERANESKSLFLANMSHEIRTPMNAILGFSEILSNLVEDGQQKNYLDSIRTSGKTLLALINDILELSKVEAGKAEVLLIPVEAHTLIRDVATLFRLEAEEKGLAFHLEIDETLPEVLLLDEALLCRSLTNLFDNAVKFTDQGFVQIQVKPVFGGGDDSQLDLVLSVSDSGIGIAEDQREEIFGAFNQQKDQSINEYGGTGLGLAITRRIVELMGGEVTLASEVGKGSTFTITLRNVEVAEDLGARGEDLDADTIHPHSTEGVADDPADTPESESTWAAESMSEAVVEQLRSLSDAFDAELHFAWESVRASANVTAAEGFAERVESLMSGCSYPPISDWAKALKAQASAFQVDLLPRTLDRFPDLVEEMRALAGGET